MAGNQIKINLAFSADTSLAKRSLQDLQTSLNSLFHSMQQSTLSNGLTTQLQAAQAEAIKLQAVLSKSVNLETGKFDLLKFQQGLKQTGTDLNQLQFKLSGAGAAGQQAFTQLAQAIATAEVPTRRFGATLASLGQTFKSTLKWQISSSVLHGLLGSVQSAYQYAQDLNHSLNDIRIVTGYNTDRMAEFAEEANRAAKALSTTTNEYAKASLIYFQQGLNDSQVTERTRATIKLANVTGQSAEEVSSYMTAVWNNFDDGTKSLEYYADAITALGAATASSSEEIANGLQKFSAVANTVGLSYEYATAALATVVAQTRESAETVGTAFKTIFARLESLSLGETLDDDTNLTKYSQALAAVGVNVKDANGELKLMDQVIDEVGQKWKEISKDQQVALAQTVAGMRQYNNFIALMNNYDAFTANVEIATDSSGTLEEQAGIYAESWEAAEKRVQAAAEAIYKDLLNDDFFIDLFNSFEKILGFIDQFLDSIGGAKGLITGLASILLHTFAGAAARGLENMVFNLRSFLGLAQKDAAKLQMEAISKALAQAQGQIASAQQATSNATLQTNNNLKTQLELTQALALKKEKLTELEQAQGTYIVQNVQQMQSQVQKKAARVDQAQAAVNSSEAEIYDQAHINYAGKTIVGKFDKIKEKLTLSETIAQELAEADQEFLKAPTEGLERYKNRINEIANKAETKGLTETSEYIKQRTHTTYGNDRKDIRRYVTDKDRKSIDSRELEVRGTRDIETYASKQFSTKGEQVVDDPAIFKKYVANLKESKESVQDYDKSVKGLGKTVEQARKDISNLGKGMISPTQRLVAGAQAAMSLSFALTSISQLDDIWSDENLTGGDKLLQTFTSLGMAIPMIVSGITGLKTAFGGLTAAVASSNLIFAVRNKLSLEDYYLLKNKVLNQRELLILRNKENIDDGIGLLLQQAENAVDKEGNRLTEDQIRLKQQEILQEQLGISADTAALILEQRRNDVSLTTTVQNVLKTKTDAAETKGIWAKVAAYLGLQAAQLPVLGTTLAIVAAIAILVAVIAGLVWAFKKMEANSPAGQLRAAKEEAKEMATALEEAKERANELKETFDKYNSVQQELSKCVQGTKEWNEALRENNAMVIDLMHKYPQLLTMMNNYDDQAITRDEKTGALKIEDWAIENLEAEANKNVLTAQTSFLAANADVREKQIIQDRSKLGNKINEDIEMRKLSSTSNSPEDATDIYTDQIAEKAELFVNKTQSEIVDILKNDFQFNVTDIYLQDWANAIYKNNEEIVKVIDSIDENTQASRLETEALKQQLLADNKVVQDSKHSEQVIAATSVGEAETLEKRIEEKMEALDEQRWGKKDISKADGVNTEAEKIFETYAKAAGLKNVTAIDTTGTDENRVFVYTDAGGDEHKVSLKEMKRTVASYQVNEEIKKEAEELAQLYNNYDDKQASFITASTGNTSFMSRNDIASYTELKDGKVEANVGKINDYTNSLELSEDDYIKLGYEGSLDQMREQFQKDIEESLRIAQEAWDTGLRSMTQTTRDSLNDLIEDQANNESFQKLTDKQLTAYGTALEGLYKNNGKQAQDDFVKTMNSLIQNNQDQADTIIQIASQVDWSNGEQSLRDFQQLLSEVGIYINENDEAWQKFAKTMAEKPSPGISVLKYNLEEIRKQLVAIQELTQDIEFGSIISDEDYKKLISYNGALAKYFQLTAEGYRYIGDEDIGEPTESFANDMLEKTLQVNEQARAGAAASKKLDYYWAKNHDGQILKDLQYITRDDNGEWDSTLAALDIDKTWLSEQADALETAKLNGDTEVEKEIEDRIKTALYDQVETLQADVKNGNYDDYKAYQVYASSLDTLDQLEAKKSLFEEAGQMDAYNKQLDYLNNRIKFRQKEIDIYQNEEAAIKRINKDLEKQNKIKENSYGRDRIKAIEEELALTEDLRKANISSRQVARQDRRSAEGDLRDIVGHTIKFEKDEYGNILNWEELDKVAAGLSEEDYEKYKETKEQYQTAQENVDKYTEAIEENEDAQKSLWLESAIYIAEFNDEIRELELDWLDYQLSHLEDVAFSTAETLALVGSQLNAYQGTATDAKNELNNIAERFKVAPRQEGESIGDFMARIIAEAPKAREEVMAVGATLKTTLENYEATDQALADSLLKHFEDIADYYDNISEKFDNMSNTIKHYRNVVDLVGKETLGITDEILTEMNKTEQALVNAGVKNSKAKYDKIAEDRANAETGLADAIAKGDEAAQARWKNTLKEIDSMEQEALQEMNDSWAAALEVAAQILEDNTQRIMDSFAKSMAGIYESFDRMSEVFGQQSELNAQYVADYKKIYELSKLTRNIQNQIDNTDSVAAKQTLKDLQQEITELQASGTKLSQYDLDYLQKKYDLRVAEITLEEAQNAKSQVRLQRMADGSWGYVYTQNAEAVENAQQNYEDKLYALQELSTGYLDETSEQIISIQAEFQEAINTIMSSGLSDAEKRKQIEETVKFYQDRLSFLTGEFDKVISNNQGMANMVQSFSETLLGALYPTEMYDFDSATDIFELFTEKLGEWESENGTGLLGQLNTVLKEYQGSVDTIFEYAGSSVKGFAEKITGDGTKENPGVLNEIINYLETTEVENPELPAIDTFIDLLSQKKDEIHGLIEGIKTDYASVMDMMSDSRIVTDSGLKRGEAISYVEESGYEPKDGWQSISDEQLLEIFQAVVMRMEPPQYDTGGYTGEWGPSGKLAMVHEKEIILNPEDTLNLLKTMEIMDGIIKAIDIESAAAASAKALTVSTVSSSSDTLQQEVTIHAEFPNATNRSEIEEAFDTLINRAAQYTNRNR